MLKELYCISEAHLGVLKFELWFGIGDLNFPTEQWFSLFYGVMLHVPMQVATLHEKVQC